MDKKLKILFPVLFFSSLAAQLYMLLLGEADYAILLSNLCTGILMLIVWADLWRSSTFRHTVYCRLSYICTALLLIGILFKVSRWENADELIFMACLGMSILYFIHFRKKKPKRLMDGVKMIYIEVSLLTIGAILFRLESKQIWIWASIVASYTLILVFYIELLKRMKLPEAELAEEGDHIFRHPDQ